jgi:hypothetical protein
MRKTKAQIQQDLIDKANVGDKVAARNVAEQDRNLYRQNLIEKAKVGDKDATRVLAEESGISEAL